MNRVKFVSSLLFLAVALLASANPAAAGVQNVKVVTDASPDYTDIPSMIRSEVAAAPKAAPIIMPRCTATFTPPMT